MSKRFPQTAYARPTRRGVAQALAAVKEAPAPAGVESLTGRVIRATGRGACALVLRGQPWPVQAAVVRALMDRAFGLRLEAPREGITLARRAVDAAQGLELRKPHRRLTHDLRAEARAHLANLLRVQGSLREAHRLWPRARAALRRGTGDVALLARLMDLEASLRKDQRRFREATELLLEVRRLYEEVLGDRHLAGRALMKLALTEYRNGDPHQGLALTVQAGHLIDSSRDPRLSLLLAFNLVGLTAESLSPRDSLLLLRLFRPYFQEQLPLSFLTRLRWLEGLLLASQGEYATAASCLGKVKAEYLEQKLVYDAALVSLDLAMVYLLDRRYHRVRELAEAMYPVFRAEGVPREASAALLLFHRSALEGNLSLDGLLQTIRDLHRHLCPPGYEGRVGVFV